MKPGVSVIVCAYNAALRIEETMRHLALQQVPHDVAWEVILVDNHSSDKTASIAKKVWDELNTKDSFRIVEEYIPGLSHARAKGFAESQYEYVIMCDDDNWLQNDYVSIVYSVMEQNINIGALGGVGEITFEVPPPDWIPLISVFATGKQNESSGKVHANFLYGAGCVIRKSALNNLNQKGYKQLLSDRQLGTLTSGGDYELCYALSIIGYDIWYDERLKFKHFITKSRLTWEYVKRYVNESSKCFEVLASYKYVANEKRKVSLFYVFLKGGQYSIRMMVHCALLRWRFPATDKRWKKAYLDFIFYRNNLISYFTGIKTRRRAHQHVLGLLASNLK